MVARQAPEAVAEQGRDLKRFENFIGDAQQAMPPGGVLAPDYQTDDGVAPSSLDQSRDSRPTESTGYGGGVY